VTYVCGGVAEVITYDSTKSVVSGGTGGEPGDVGIDASKWAVIQTYNDVGGDVNHLLEPGEQFVLAVKLPTTKPTNNVRFSVNLHPAVGAVYPIERTVPPYLNTVNILT